MIIDIHSHIYPKSYLNVLKSRNLPPRLVDRGEESWLVLYPDKEGGGQKPSGSRLSPHFSSVDEKLHHLDRYGIESALISLGNPWFDFLPRDEASMHVRAINDELTVNCIQHKHRLWLLAVLPTTDLEAAISELERVVTIRQVVGVIVGTRISGAWLDDNLVKPFWSCVESLNLPIFLHPHQGVGGLDLVIGNNNLRPALGFPFETCVAATRLILGGILDEFPNLRIILSHGGGAFPALVGRLDAYCGARLTSSNQHLSLPAYVKRFYYDAITYDPSMLRTLIDYAGSDRVLFGTDHPYSARDPNYLKTLIHQAGLNKSQSEQVLCENARLLFNRLL